MTTRTKPGLGLLKGLGVTLKHMLRPAVTRQYPHVKPDLAPRTRGVIALMEENCTVCMLCAKECPDWCIYIESHKETVVTDEETGRTRTRNVLDRFAIDFALCMYCGICIEVCPFEALFWSPEFEYSEYSMDGLLHESEKLREWMDTVPAPPPLEDGAEPPSEVSRAVDTARKAAEKAREERLRQLQEATGRGDGAQQQRETESAEPEIHVEDVEVDQEIYDKLIADGTSDRVARAKAKAAFVRRRKAELREEAKKAAAAAPPAPAEPAAEPEAAAEAPAEAPAQEPEPAQEAEPPPHIEAGEIDQETYDRLIAEGTSERIARAKAKRAYVLKKKREHQGGDE